MYDIVYCFIFYNIVLLGEGFFFFLFIGIFNVFKIIFGIK